MECPLSRSHPLRDLIRLPLAVAFWTVNLWWLGSAVQAVRFAGDGRFRVYSVTNDGVTHEAWGLTFTGTSGVLLALGYIVLVTCALVVSVRGRGSVRMAAAATLVAWALLFTVNSLLLARWSGLAWWDAVNVVGTVAVVAHLALGGKPRRRPPHAMP